MRFSERHGYKDVRTVLQREDIDEDLRVALWNAIYQLVCEPIEQRSHALPYTIEYTAPDKVFASHVWTYIGGVLDELAEPGDFTEYVKEHIFQAEWYEV